MALGHAGLLHEVLGLLANLFLGCPPAQKAFGSTGNPSLLQRTLHLIFKPSLDLSTFQVQLNQSRTCRLPFPTCSLSGMPFRMSVPFKYHFTMLKTRFLLQRAAQAAYGSHG